MDDPKSNQPDSAQESILFSLAKSSTPSAIEARYNIIQQHRRLVFSIAKPFSSNPTLFEDLKQEGFLGLLEAIQSFNPRLGTKFITHAFYIVRRRIFAYVTKENQYKVAEPPRNNKEGISYEDEVVEEVEDQFGIPEVLDHILYYPRLHQEFRLLSEKQQEALHLKFWEQKSNSEIAFVLHVSRPRVTKLIATGVEKLKKSLDKHGVDEQANQPHDN